jgi:uncharacterized membrane protein
MSVDTNTLLAIIGMALATYLTRIAGLWLLQLANVRGRARSAMDALPPAVLMAVIAPTRYWQPGWQRHWLPLSP